MSEKEFNLIFSQRLRYFMEMNNLTQTELAKKLDVSSTSVSNWYNGTKSPRMDKIDAMCEIFGCLRSDLMQEPDEKSPYYLNPETAALAQEIHDNADMRILFSAARDISPEDMKLLQGMALALKKKEKGE